MFSAFKKVSGLDVAGSMTFALILVKLFGYVIIPTSIIFFPFAVLITNTTIEYLFNLKK